MRLIVNFSVEWRRRNKRDTTERKEKMKNE
jgi:hypothetical protein